MTVYEKVVEAIHETKTLAWHITNFGKIRLKTEDIELIKALDGVIESLQRDYTHISKNKSLPVCLNKDTTGSLKDELKVLYSYCNKNIQKKKPEWQVLAERYGWLPPQK